MEADNRRSSGGSTERHDDSDTAGSKFTSVFEDRATHVGDTFEEKIVLCREAVLSDTGLDHVAHFTVGVCDFSIDMLARRHVDLASTSGEAERRALGRLREDYRRIGRQVAFAANNLDRTLEDVRSGTVIRLVLHASDGMFICCPVIPKEYLVALTVDPSARPTAGIPLTNLPGAARVDATAAGLVTACRHLLGLRTQDPGGWPQPRSEGASHEDDPLRYLNAPDQRSVADLCRAAIDPDDLHYVAHCRGSDVITTADHLGHHAISRFFTQISPEARRKFYGDLCRGLSLLAGQVGRVVGPAIGCPVQRMILDLQQGAIYYYRLRPSEYLVGVTLDQRGVETADQRMAILAVQCAALLLD